jgi:hypothetical protein
MPRRKWIVRVPMALAAFVFAVLPAAYWDGGLIEKESTFFVRQYLDGRPVLQKVFDPHANDIGTYQARELSYFFDWMDAQALRASVANDPGFLVPFSALAAGCLTVAIFVVSTARWFPRVPPVTATLILLLYLTNHVYSVTTAVYYRSAKPLLAPIILAALFHLAGVFARPGAPAAIDARILTRGSVVTFLLGCTMSLLDRQGFFYAFVMVVALALWHRARHNVRDCLLGGVAAVAAMVVYNVALGPWLVRSINGYSPSFEYQQVDVHHLIRHPLHFVQAIRLLVEHAQVVLGSVPLWLCGAAGAMLLVLRSRRRTAHATVPSRSGVSPARRIAAAVAVSQVIMFAVMIVRHPPIWDWQDHKLWYYPLPFQVLVLFGVLIVIDRALQSQRVRPLILNAALVLVVAANLSSWPRYRTLMLSSEWFPAVYQQSNLLKRSLERRTPADGLDPDYRRFYDDMAPVAAPQR